MSSKAESPISRSLQFVSVITMIVAIGLAGGPAIYACPLQDEEAVSTTPDNNSLDALLTQWQGLEAELVSLEQQFKIATEPEKQEDLRGRYKALVDQANSVIADIKSKAIEAFNDKPDDARTSRLLVGILKNDAEFNRNDDAIKLGNQLIAGGVDGKLFETAAKSDKISITTRELLEELFIRFNQNKADDLPRVKIETSKGDIVVELFEEEAPNTVANFVNLVENKFYDGLKFHRVIEGFMAQGGDPNGDGSGGPGYSIACECYEVEARRHYIGSLSMAHAGKDTGGSQFFICLTRTPNLNELHTVFGRVVEGLDVLDKLSRNYTSAGPIPNSDSDVIKSMQVIRKREHEYQPVKIGEEKPIDPPPAQPESMKAKDPAVSESDGSGDNQDDEPSAADNAPRQKEESVSEETADAGSEKSGESEGGTEESGSEESADAGSEDSGQPEGGTEESAVPDSDSDDDGR